MTGREGPFDVEIVSANLLEPVFAATPAGEIRFVNERFLTVADLSRDEVIGNDLAPFEGIVEKGYDDFLAAFEAVGRGESDQERVELTKRHPESAPVPRRLSIEARVTPIVEDGYITGVLVVCRDTSKRKAHEEELERQNERLEAFAGLVSHDLRNPLNVAQCALELVDCEHEELETIDDALTRMEELIEDLLTLAREGRSIDDLESVSLEAVAADAWRTVETSAATFATEDVTVLADRRRLEQALENLFRNSVEHGSTSHPSQARDDAVEHGGEDVRIRVGPLPGGFFVADDGPGIPAERREQVFDPGYSTREEGTGFGLAIVGEIADAHGWDVRATEGETSGARFEFTDVELAER